MGEPPLPKRRRKVVKQSQKKRANTGVVNLLQKLGKMTGIKTK